jgi:plastocyanin
VSRVALAAAVALALAALALAPGLAPTAAGGRAAAADCSWQRQAKRVVRHVRRQGRPRRLVRVVHRWVCVPLAAAPAAPSTPTGPAPAPAPAPTAQPPNQPPTPEIGHLGVKAEDSGEPWSFTLSRPNVAAGEVIVELNNKGGDPHNLNLQLVGGEEAPLQVSEAGPEEHRAGRFTLAPGTYRLWCSLPEHEAKGMSATLVVDPPQ